MLSITTDRLADEEVWMGQKPSVWRWVGVGLDLFAIVVVFFSFLFFFL